MIVEDVVALHKEGSRLPLDQLEFHPDDLTMTATERLEILGSMLADKKKFADDVVTYGEEFIVKIVATPNGLAGKKAGFRTSNTTRHNTYQDLNAQKAQLQSKLATILAAKGADAAKNSKLDMTTDNGRGQWGSNEVTSQCNNVANQAQDHQPSTAVDVEGSQAGGAAMDDESGEDEMRMNKRKRT